jgi:hypothetical protein
VRVRQTQPAVDLRGRGERAAVVLADADGHRLVEARHLGIGADVRERAVLRQVGRQGTIAHRFRILDRLDHDEDGLVEGTGRDRDPGLPRLGGDGVALGADDLDRAVLAQRGLGDRRRLEADVEVGRLHELDDRQLGGGIGAPVRVEEPSFLPFGDGVVDQLERLGLRVVRQPARLLPLDIGELLLCRVAQPPLREERVDPRADVRRVRRIEDGRRGGTGRRASILAAGEGDDGREEKQRHARERAPLRAEHSAVLRR